MKKFTPLKLWFVGSVIIFLPFIKMWFEAFLKHPFGVSGLTGSIIFLISMLWAIWYNPDKNNDVKKD